MEAKNNYKELKAGNLYLLEYDEENIIPQAKDSDRLVDKTSGNFHLYPSNIKLEEFCSKVIEKKLEDIKDYIKNHEENIIIEKYKKYRKEKCIAECRIKKPYSKGKYAGMHLFNYLKVFGENTTYDLTGIRFFIDQNDQVNCILLCFQIEICGSESNKDGKTGIKKYPHTPYDGEGNERYYNLDKDSEGNKIDINSDAEKIAEAFLNFVLEKETGKAQKKEEHQHD